MQALVLAPSMRIVVPGGANLHAEGSDTVEGVLQQLGDQDGAATWRLVRSGAASWARLA